MGELIIMLLIIATSIYSLKLGVEMLAIDLYRRNRISSEEFENFNSWKYILKRIKDDI